LNDYFLILKLFTKSAEIHFEIQPIKCNMESRWCIPIFIGSFPSHRNVGKEPYAELKLRRTTLRIT